MMLYLKMACACVCVCAVQDALAKLAAAKSALEAEQQLTAKRGSQVNELASQVESLKATLGTVNQRASDGPAMASLTAQLSDRDDKIAVSRLLCRLHEFLRVSCVVTG
jgi:flagellar biosynthesis/type III secretory pathway chaperone